MNNNNPNNYGRYESTANRIAVGILIIIISLLATLSLCNALGNMGKMISGFLIGVFGFVAYAYAICGIIIGAAVTLGRRPTLAADKALKYIFLFVLGVMIFHVWFTKGMLEGNNYGGFLKQSYNIGTPAGWIGSIFAYPVMKLSITFFLIVLLVLFSAAALASFYPLFKRKSPYRAKQTKIKRFKDDKPSLTDFSKQNPDERAYPTDVGSRLFIGTIDNNGEGPEFKLAGKKQIKQQQKQGFDAMFPNKDSADKVNDSEIEAMPESEEERRRRSREKLFGNRKAKNDAQNNDGDKPVLFGTSENDDVIPAHKKVPKSSLPFNFNVEMQNDKADSKPKSIIEAFGIDNTEEGRIKDMQERIGYIINSDVKPSDVYGAASKRIVNPKATPPVEPEPAPEVEKPQPIIKDTRKNVEPDENMPAFIKDILFGEKKDKPSVDKTPRQEPTVSEIKPIPPMPPRPFVESKLHISKPTEEKPSQAPAYEEKPTPSAEPVQSETPKNGGIGVEEVGSIFSLFGKSKKPKASDAPAKPVENKTQYPTVDDSPSLGDFSRFEKPQNIVTPSISETVDTSVIMPSESEVEKVEKEIDAPVERNKAKDDVALEKPSSYNNDFPIGKKAEPVKLSPETPKKTKPEQISIDQAIKERGLSQPYLAPPIELLFGRDDLVEIEDYADRIDILERTLSQFKVDAKVIGVTQGPTFSRFELKMPDGVSVNNVLKLDHDLAMKLCADKIRFEAPIPGRDAFGIEVPNRKRATVSLKNLVMSEEFNRAKSILTFALGKDIANTNNVCDLESMPHMLIAGATGSGKSVCINSLIVSLLYRCGPNDLKLILVDPKQVELNLYSGLPHLLVPEVIDDPEIAINALDWLIVEMKERFQMFKKNEVRNIAEYNAVASKKGSGLNKIPRIVCVIDELADFILVKKKEIEDRIGKITRLSRAAGIHLVVATQRPSVDIVTGTIKSNLPSRIAFAVTSTADSMTILGGGGAEKLLGKGDMLYAPQGKEALRLQCTLVERDEVKAVVDYIKANNECFYDTEIQNSIYAQNENEEDDESTDSPRVGKSDQLFVEALRLCVMEQQASISRLQMKFSIGYPTAAKLIEEMEQKRYVSSNKGGNKRRDVLLSLEQFNQIYGVTDDLEGFNG